MSFPQQGKNMNGELNVNGTTTVLGSGVPSSHPPSAPYPHMSNHHQSSMGYDYLWGGHPQYGPAMGSSPGQGMHQKQPAPGMPQPQSQHHFQGHGQYQLNGGIESSHQPPVAGPPNMPLTGSQYWNRSNPGPQQIGYNSHSMYGTYQSQAHLGITPSQHHQQQSLQPPQHQPSQQHLHSHRHQQHQQPQHYGMMPNGMPYYQHQPQHQTLPSPQQQPPLQSQPQGLTQLKPPAAQNFTPPRGSPQHHSLGRAGNGSPLPVGMTSATMISPSTVQDSGSPKIHNRDSGMSSLMQGHTREAVKEVDTSYNGSERSPVAHRLPTADSYQSKPSATLVGPASDYRQNSEMASPVRDPPSNPSPQCVSSRLSTSPSPAAVSPSLKKSSSAPAVYGSPKSSPGPQNVSSLDVEFIQPQISASHTVASVQGVRPLPFGQTEIAPTGSKHLTAGSSSSSLPTSPLKLTTPSSASTNNEPRHTTASSVSPVSLHWSLCLISQTCLLKLLVLVRLSPQQTQCPRLSQRLHQSRFFSKWSKVPACLAFPINLEPSMKSQDPQS
ncbi:unnamed protein product [Pleuronectes platessa]|uniref:Uncharacterized protein n=1 Tax=Pleuronectes platessa TaxID=8262 RepID=A0A9N7Z2B8_PLEPL|nr:unnamed protein product [Pleuronectes platessa]